MRDRIIHGYDRVDMEIVWNTVQEVVPTVRPLLRQILIDYGRKE